MGMPPEHRSNQFRLIGSSARRSRAGRLFILRTPCVLSHDFFENPVIRGIITPLPFLDFCAATASIRRSGGLSVLGKAMQNG
jgi:hypothetical protein